MTVDEMLRLACIYAERDQCDFLLAIEDADELLEKDTKDFIKKIRAYRLKRWGKTKMERLLEKAKYVKVGKGPGRG